MSPDKLTFKANIVEHNGKPALQIDKIFSLPEEIKEIVKKINAPEPYTFEGVLEFRDKFLAIQRLKEAGLLREK
jgi:hypothetical protein